MSADDSTFAFAHSGPQSHWSLEDWCNFGGDGHSPVLQFSDGDLDMDFSGSPSLIFGGISSGQELSGAADLAHAGGVTRPPNDGPHDAISASPNSPDSNSAVDKHVSCNPLTSSATDAEPSSNTQPSLPWLAPPTKGAVVEPIQYDRPPPATVTALIRLFCLYVQPSMPVLSAREMQSLMGQGERTDSTPAPLNAALLSAVFFAAAPVRFPPDLSLILRLTRLYKYLTLKEARAAAFDSILDARDCFYLRAKVRYWPLVHHI